MGASRGKVRLRASIFLIAKIKILTAPLCVETMGSRVLIPTGSDRRLRAIENRIAMQSIRNAYCHAETGRRKGIQINPPRGRHRRALQRQCPMPSCYETHAHWHTLRDRPYRSTLPAPPGVIPPSTNCRGRIKAARIVCVMNER